MMLIVFGPNMFFMVMCKRRSIGLSLDLGKFVHLKKWVAKAAFLANPIARRTTAALAYLYRMPKRAQVFPGQTVVVVIVAWRREVADRRLHFDDTLVVFACHGLELILHPFCSHDLAAFVADELAVSQDNSIRHWPRFLVRSVAIHFCERLLSASFRRAGA